MRAARSVVRLVVGKATVLVGCGVALGLVSSIALMRAVERLVFGVRAAEPASLLLPGVTLLAIGAGPVWAQSFTAAVRRVISDSSGAAVPQRARHGDRRSAQHEIGHTIGGIGPLCSDSSAAQHLVGLTRSLVRPSAAPQTARDNSA
jgi:hypothetical protein